MDQPRHVTTLMSLINGFAALLCIASGAAIAEPTGTDTEIAETGDVPLLAAGPISAINAETGAITVNGQVYVLDDQTTVYPATDIRGDATPLQLQDYVAVFGEIMDPGLGLATIVEELPEAYVAGSSAAYLLVILETNDTDSASALSGQTVIDYTAALTTPDLLNAEEGQWVEFLGVSYGDTFFAIEGLGIDTASDLIALEEALAYSSGLLGIRGSGVRGIRGSGVRGIRGSGVRGIRGSGVRSTVQLES